MSIAITGTPGTGKTTVSEELRSRGVSVCDLNAWVRENGLVGDYDEGRDTHEVDPKDLEARFGTDAAIVEGHLSHLTGAGTVIVLRCDPRVVEGRLLNRGYSAAKARENAEAEALDVILLEAIEECDEVLEVDVTSLSPSEAADAVQAIMGGEREKYAVGDVDWSEVLLLWC